jgi:hypothetical protein
MCHVYAPGGNVSDKVTEHVPVSGTQPTCWAVYHCSSATAGGIPIHSKYQLEPGTACQVNVVVEPCTSPFGNTSVAAPGCAIAWPALITNTAAEHTNHRRIDEDLMNRILLVVRDITAQRTRDVSSQDSCGSDVDCRPVGLLAGFYLSGMEGER